MQPHYLRIEEMLALIQGKTTRDACIKILSDHRGLFQKVQGSTNNHQAWPGGYFDHVQEIMNIAFALFPVMNSIRPLPFTLSDALLIVYLHDIEKPWKYELRDGELKHKEEMQTKEAAQAFREKMLAEYGIVLTADQQNALKYVEGEYTDYTNQRRVMNPLAAFCHMCDVASARIWFDHPMIHRDPWFGASRVRDV